MKTVMTPTGACKPPQPTFFFSFFFFKKKKKIQLGPLTNLTSPVGFYAGLNLIAWFMIFCFVRETKQLTLEELDQVFSVPTSQFIGYELKVWLPYFIKRYVFFRNIPKPPPIIEKENKEIESEQLPGYTEEKMN